MGGFSLSISQSIPNQSLAEAWGWEPLFSECQIGNRNTWTHLSINTAFVSPCLSSSYYNHVSLFWNCVNFAFTGVIIDLLYLKLVAVRQASPAMYPITWFSLDSRCRKFGKHLVDTWIVSQYFGNDCFFPSQIDPRCQVPLRWVFKTPNFLLDRSVLQFAPAFLHL